MRIAPLFAYLALASIALEAAPSNTTLLDLAKKRFAPRELTDAEQKLFTNTERGEAASALTGDDKQDNPDNAGTWPDARVVHAECLAWLCTDREASSRVRFRGIRIYGIRIDGKLDLDFAQIPLPLGTWKCTFTDEINLLQAHLAALHLQFTHVKSITGDGVKIDGDAFLRGHFKAKGEIRLLGATIGGDLSCRGAQLSNPDGKVLNADGAKIDGNVFLSDGFKADGNVDFTNIEVKGYFNCYKNAAAEISGFDFRSAKVGTLRDGAASWPGKGKLFLDGFIYGRIEADAENDVRTDAESRIEWLQRQPHVKFLPQPYEQLASVLRRMGYERDARLVMIQKNQDHANFTKRFSQEWWWYNVFGWLIGYGYAPSRAFFISLGMIALGYVLFKVGYVVRSQLILPTDENGYVKDAAGQILLTNGKRTFSEEYPKFNAFVYSLESFTPLLKLGQSSSWAPNAKRGKCFCIPRLHFTTGSLLRAYLWFHIMAGWVLTSLWVGALTGLVKS